MWSQGAFSFHALYGRSILITDLVEGNIPFLFGCLDILSFITVDHSFCECFDLSILYLATRVLLGSSMSSNILRAKCRLYLVRAGSRALTMSLEVNLGRAASGL